MSMAPELMEGEGAYLRYRSSRSTGKLIESLFNQIATSDDTQINARKQSELQQISSVLPMFRTYFEI